MVLSPINFAKPSITFTNGKQQTTMNTQSTLEQLRQLKLYGMAGLYQSVLEQPLHQQPEPHLLLGMLAEPEIQWRQMARNELYLRLSKLRYQALP